MRDVLREKSFRVDFALHVALSQILAGRSSARVRTLATSEEFGTRDQEGIERLVEVIQDIREDFAKIPVITHLPRPKEAFPVRIEVEKDPVSGSTFERMDAKRNDLSAGLRPRCSSSMSR